MNLTEHLITILGEEGAEVAQICSKVNRFGLRDISTHIDPDGKETLYPKALPNVDRLVAELNDVLAVADMLVNHGVLPKKWQNPEAQAEKQAKVVRYLEYSRRRGLLTDL